MELPNNYAILTNNTSDTKSFVRKLLKGAPIPGFELLKGKKGLLFSRSEIQRFMDEEERHDIKIITQNTSQSLKSMSSGEQKKALLNHLISQQPNFMVLINPFDNLDIESQQRLNQDLITISRTTSLVQVLSRQKDILPNTTDFFRLEDDQLIPYKTPEAFWKANLKSKTNFKGHIPAPIHPMPIAMDTLVKFKNVSVSFEGRQVLNQINWTVKKGEFWQLIGPNGSGKTTMLSMITGDSHKGYGQNLVLFGQRKGSGESVWDHKKNIGYYTPAMTDKFGGYHSVENMIISGFYDSIGLYNTPTDHEKRVASAWLDVLQLQDKKHAQFFELSQGQKRLVMTARAMVKHPPLLILDEPTAGLDDANAELFIALVNKIAKESESAIVFVSHRKEANLEPELIYELVLDENGSVGNTKNPEV